MQAATDTIILTDSTTPEKPKFDIQKGLEKTFKIMKSYYLK